VALDLKSPVPVWFPVVLHRSVAQVEWYAASVCRLPPNLLKVEELICLGPNITQSSDDHR
jgi:hypothetical protein